MPPPAAGKVLQHRLPAARFASRNSVSLAAIDGGLITLDGSGTGTSHWLLDIADGFELPPPELLLTATLTAGLPPSFELGAWR